MEKRTVHIPFASRDELSRLDAAARRHGGVRGTTVFRPCFQHVTGTVKAHTATYLFTTEEYVQAFVREQGTL